MKYRTITAKELLCDRCGESLGNLIGFPYFSENDNNYCPDCALILGVIDINEYLNCNCSFCSRIDHAEYNKELHKITAYIKTGRGFHKEIINVGQGI